MAVNEVTVKFKGTASFRQYITKKKKGSGINIYEECDDSGYRPCLYMRGYLGKDTQTAIGNMTAIHSTAIHLTSNIEGEGQKVSMYNFLPHHPHLETREINECRTVQCNQKDVPPDLQMKKMKLKRCDIPVRTRGQLTAVVWKDKREDYMMTNMDQPPAKGSFVMKRKQP